MLAENARREVRGIGEKRPPLPPRGNCLAALWEEHRKRNLGTRRACSNVGARAQLPRGGRGGWQRRCHCLAPRGSHSPGIAPTSPGFLPGPGARRRSLFFFFFCTRDQRDRRLSATERLTSSFGDHSDRKKMSQAGQQDPGDEWEPRRPHCTPTRPTPSGLGAPSRDVRPKNRGFP